MYNYEHQHPAEQADEEQRSEEAYKKVKPELEEIKRKLSDDGEQDEEDKGTFSQKTIEDARRQADELHPEE